MKFFADFLTRLTRHRFGLFTAALGLLAAAGLAVMAVAAAPDFTGETSGIPSLWHNDKVFTRHDIMPLCVIDGVCYIPRDFLRMLNYIEMDTKDNYREYFYIMYNNQRFITFRVSSNNTALATTNEKENIPCKVHIINSITYIPAQLTADALGLSWEYRPEYKAGRMKEAGAVRKFDDLLLPYINKTEPQTEPPQTEPPTKPPATEPPTEPPITEPTTQIYEPPHINTPAVTEPPTPEPSVTEPPTAENTRDIENYLAFYIDPPAGAAASKTAGKADEILKILEKYGIQATFFFSRDEILENPDTVKKIYASGHGLGIKLCAEDTSDVFAVAAELEEANALIYSAIKHKTRFFIFSGLRENEYYAPGPGLRQQGYYRVAVIGAGGLKGVKNAAGMTEFIKRRRSNVFAFDLYSAYMYHLGWSAGAAREKFYINFSCINNAMNT